MILAGYLSDNLFRSRRMPVTALGLLAPECWCRIPRVAGYQMVRRSGAVWHRLFRLCRRFAHFRDSRHRFWNSPRVSTAAGLINACGSVGAIVGGTIPGWIERHCARGKRPLGLGFSRIGGAYWSRPFCWCPNGTDCPTQRKRRVDVTNKTLPKQARAVIVGGGIAGCSVAYHLTKVGWKDVVLLEQGELAGGTTWHAAGMVGRLRTSSAMARINDASAKLYAGLEAETGLPTGWKQVGSLLVARTEDRMVQFRRTAAMSEYFGIDVRLIGVEEAVAKWPIMRPDDLIGAVWLPDDGKVQPKLTAVALGKGAEQRAATVLENVRVLSLLHREGRVTGVRTADGDIAAEVIVLCGGMWTRPLALTCGVNVPLYPVEHHYVLSNPIPGVTDDFPCTRDPDGEIYFRTEGAGPPGCISEAHQGLDGGPHSGRL